MIVLVWLRMMSTELENNELFNRSQGGTGAHKIREKSDFKAEDYDESYFSEK